MYVEKISEPGSGTKICVPLLSLTYSDIPSVQELPKGGFKLGSIGDAIQFPPDDANVSWPTNYLYRMIGIQLTQQSYDMKSSIEQFAALPPPPVTKRGRRLTRPPPRKKREPRPVPLPLSAYIQQLKLAIEQLKIIVLQ